MGNRTNAQTLAGFVDSSKLYLMPVHAMPACVVIGRSLVSKIRAYVSIANNKGAER